MSEEGKSLAERLFDGSNAQGEIEWSLYEEGVPFGKIGWDDYDKSIELYDVPADYRLDDKVQAYFCNAGFATVYVNHVDKWETHYGFWNKEKQCYESPVKGWRVSYPHKRGEEKGKIWVEEVIETWPKEWFETGYVIVKENDQPS